jgi:hypothetical protein
VAEGRTVAAADEDGGRPGKRWGEARPSGRVVGGVRGEGISPDKAESLLSVRADLPNGEEKPDSSLERCVAREGGTVGPSATG